MNEQKETWIVDDIQRVVNVENFEVRADGKIHILQPRSHAGMDFAPEFVYASEEDACQEVHNRHVRLNKAFSNRDLLACLSINKEPERKSQGATDRDLSLQAKEDKESYRLWVATLKKEWEQINHEKADLQKLSQTLRNARLIKDALSNPLAIDFTEIMAREAAIKTRESKAPEL